jgi:hypothetical protein
MADFVFNIAKGEVKNYCKLAAANDALIVVLVETAGIEADATLKDYDDLAALIAGTSNEQTNQARKAISASVTITVDDTNDRVDIDVPDQVYTALAGNQISAVLFCYDGDTTAGTDAAITPLTKHDAAITPDGSTVTVQIAAAGFFRAA